MLWNSCFEATDFSARTAKWRCRYLSWKLNRTASSCGKTEKKLRGLYRLMQTAIVEENEVIAYRTMEWMKVFLERRSGSGEEAGRMLQLCGLAVEHKQQKIAGLLLGVCRMFFRDADERDAAPRLLDAAILLNMAKRTHQEYIMDQAAQCILCGAARIREEKNYALAVETVRAVGLNALKTRDVPLFKLAARTLAGKITPRTQTLRLTLRLTLSLWLHQILKQDSGEALHLFQKMAAALAAGGAADDVAQCAAAEAENAAGLIGIHRRMRCRGDFIEFLLAVSQDCAANLRRAACGIGRMARIAAKVHGIDEAYSLYLPFLEVGRKLLRQEIRFQTLSDQKRQGLLSVFIWENILIIEILAKENGLTAPALILSLREYWLRRYAHPAARRSIEQICQLLLFRLVAGRKSQQRRLGKRETLLLRQSLFDPLQQQKLGIQSC